MKINYGQGRRACEHVEFRSQKMTTIENPPSIHFRRRWYYVLWVLLLVAAAGFVAWWETPAREGFARFRIAIMSPDLPAGTKGALWTGPTKSWKGDWNPGSTWTLCEGTRLVASQQSLRISQRRLGQGLLMRRTHDLAVLVLEAPSGERRYFVYDLREDLVSLLAIGRNFGLEIPVTWEQLPREVVFPTDSKRMTVGH
jgi:hypothetical protein